MAAGTFSQLIKVAGETLRSVMPSWLRTMFLAEPSAKLLYLGTWASTPKGSFSAPLSVLTERGQSQGGRVVDVVLPCERVLERRIKAPLANRANQHAMAELDLQRRTPFALTDVYWALGNRSGPQDEHLRQLIVKKADIAHYRAILSTHGYKVRRFVIEEDKQSVVLADFTSEVAPSGKLLRTCNLVLAVTIVVALLSVWLQPAWQAQVETTRQTAIVDELRSEAVALRSEIEALKSADAERDDFVNDFIQRRRVVDAIRQLTVSLPDHVWASDMIFTSDQITLNGETSQSAADLVLGLTNASFAYVPALTGPVSRTVEGKERFGIVFRPAEEGR